MKKKYSKPEIVSFNQPFLHASGYCGSGSSAANNDPSLCTTGTNTSPGPAVFACQTGGTASIGCLVGTSPN